MKLATFLVAATLGISSGAFAAGDHKGHEHDSKGSNAHADDVKPSHGGVVAVNKDVNYELVVRPDVITLYITDHGKPVDLVGAAAKLTLLSASKKEDVTLTPASESLQAKGAFTASAGTKIVANVTLKGQPTHAVRFTLK